MIDPSPPRVRNKRPVLHDRPPWVELLYGPSPPIAATRPTGERRRLPRLAIQLHKRTRGCRPFQRCTYGVGWIGRAYGGWIGRA